MVLQQKSFDFAVRIVRFYKYLVETQKEFVLSKQILRSGTSIGANVREGLNAQSKLDFISKLSIALKEAEETAYWLELFLATDYIEEKQFQSLHDDCVELLKLLTAIIKRTRENL